MSTDALFAAPLAASTLRASASSAKSRLIVPVTVYALPPNATREDALNLMLLCSISCTSTTGSLEQWKSLAATYIHAATSGLVDNLPRDQFKITVITPAQRNHLAAWYAACLQREDETPDIEDPHPADAIVSILPTGMALPQPAPIQNAGFVTYDRDVKEMISHLSIVVFLAGKKVDETNRTAITERRPRALIEKFKIENTGLLTGSLRISDHAQLQLNQAWLELTTLKAACFREFASYTHKDTDLQEDILLTTVNLMRHMQMQHAVLIYKFLLTYPWVREFSPLRRYVAIFDANVATAAKIDEHLQPFIKIIYGDKSGLFPRKELGPLIACALASEEVLNTTLSQYYHDDTFGSVIAAFSEEKARREATAVPEQPASAPAAVPDNGEVLEA